MKDIQNRLDFTISKSDDILKHFNDSGGSDTHLFCLYIIERLNFSSTGLSVISKEILSKTQLEYSAGIIIRTVLLDYMILLNAHVIVLDNINDNNKLLVELNKFCSIMLSDSVNHTLKDFDKIKISKEGLATIYSNIVRMYSDCFEPYNNDGSRPIPKISEYYSPGRLFENLFKSKDFNKFSSVYQGYLFYSKYDHFGKVYYDLLSHDFLARKNKMNESIKLFPRMLLFAVAILVILYPKDDLLIQKLKLIEGYCDSY